MFTIKDGADNKSYATVGELQEALRAHHRDSHVAINVTSPRTGMSLVRFVSVDASGQVFDSYGDKGPFDFKELERIPTL